MSLLVSRTWEFTTADRRHRVDFVQSTLSGKRVLTVDGEEKYRVNLKYKLTGFVDFRVDGTPAQIVIEARDHGRLHYTLIVGGTPIHPEGDERVLSVWQVAAGPHRVEFDHRTFDIFVDSVKVPSEGEFVDEGSRYGFTMPSGAPAAITVLPASGKGDKVPVTLEVGGVVVDEAPDDDVGDAPRGK